jgi:hypothetical protein
MGLVDYSDSESEAEVVVVAKPSPSSAVQTATNSKKPFQKVVDRSKPGKILVNLPGSKDNPNDAATNNDDQPPAKRARVSRGGAFSGLNSFLPPPKNTAKQATSAGSSKGTNAPQPGINLKTGAAPGFSRSTDEDYGGETDGDDNLAPGSGMGLPAPQSQQPTIPAGQKPADEVELVGKPLMFKPLSVSRRPAKKATAKSTNTSQNATAPATTTTSNSQTTQALEAKGEPTPKKKKISLFSISDDVAEEPESKDESNGIYEPLVDTDDTPADAFAAYDAQYNTYAASSQVATVSSAYGAASNSLESIASDMNLSAAARRELFGRRGAPSAGAAAAKVINFDTEQEYAHNEVLRASGEQQTHNPVRAIAPGKHNLRQLVTQVQNQREALEESFAKGKAKQSEAGSRYGWR